MSNTTRRISCFSSSIRDVKPLGNTTEISVTRKIGTFSRITKPDDKSIKDDDVVVDDTMDFSEDVTHRYSEFSADSNSRERKEFMTPTIIKQQLIEMKRRPNMRFMRLIKSCKITANSLRTIEEIDILKKIMVKELTFMLSEYTEMLSANPSLQLNTYFRINSIIPEATKASKELSKTMIRCNRIRNSTGIIPPKNQRELSSNMNAWINVVKDAAVSDAMGGLVPGMLGDGDQTL